MTVETMQLATRGQAAQEPAAQPNNAEPPAAQPAEATSDNPSEEQLLSEAAKWIQENDIDFGANTGEQPPAERPAEPTPEAAQTPEAPQGEQQPPAATEGGQQPAGGPRETVEVERPDLAGLAPWKRAMVMRKEASAGRQDAASQQQEQFLQRLSAIEQAMQRLPMQPQQPVQPAVHPEVVAALQSGSPLQVMQAMAKHGGQPVDKSVQQLYSELTQPAPAKAPEQPKNGAQDKLMLQVLQKLEALEKAPQQWRAEQEQQQRIAAMQSDYDAFRTIPMSEEYKAKWPHLANLPPELFVPLVSEAVEEHHKQGVPVNHFQLATHLDEQAKGWFTHMQSRLSGTGQPPAAQQGNPPPQGGNQQSAPQVQGTPLGTSAPGKPESNATAISNADGATATRDLSEAEEREMLTRTFDGLFNLNPDNWG